MFKENPERVAEPKMSPAEEPVAPATVENSQSVAVEAPETSELKPEKSWDADSEGIEDFLRSFEITPVQRKAARFLIKEIKEGGRLADQLAACPPEVRQDERLRRLVEKRILEDSNSGLNFRFHVGNLEELIDNFNLEESFFQQPAFDDLRRVNWQERLSRGDRVDREAHWAEGISPVEPEKIGLAAKEEAFEYGSLAESGLKLDSAEVRETALKGLAQKLLGIEPYQKNDRAVRIKEYKDIFQLTGEEINRALVEEFKERGLYDLKKDDYWRNRYPAIDEFLDSKEAKELAKELAVKKLSESHCHPEFLEYFSLRSSDFDPVIMKVKKKEWAKDDLERHLKEKEPTYLLYDLKDQTGKFSQAEWQALAAPPASREVFVEALAHDLIEQRQETVKLFKNLGLDDLIQAGGAAAVRQGASLRHNKELLEKIVQSTGLPAAEFRENFTKGLIASIPSGLSGNQIESQFKENGLEPADSPAVQDLLKEVSLKEIAAVRENALGAINNHFPVRWSAADRPARNQAVKEALTHKLYQFRSLEELRNFVDEYAGERHKIFLLMDPEIKQAAQKYLINLPFSSGVQYSIREKMTFPDFVKYFNLNEGEVLSAIRQKIRDGQFISDGKVIYNFRTYYPQIDLDQENLQCLAAHGPALADRAWEDKDWSFISRLEAGGEMKTNEAITTELNHQEEIIKDPNKSAALKLYALEATLSLKDPDWARVIQSHQKMIAQLLESDPDSAPRVKEIIERTPDETSILYFPDLWQYLGEAAGAEFEKKLALISDLNPHIISWLARAEPYVSLLARYEAYSPEDRQEFLKMLAGDNREEIPEFKAENWSPALVAYVSAVEDRNRLKYDNQQKQIIKGTFDGAYKDVALDGLQTAWREFLKDRERGVVPPQLLVVGRAIDDAGGAGNLKHVEVLGNLIDRLDRVLVDNRTVPRTKEELRDLLSSQEERSKREKWSQDDRSEFYSLSQDIIEAAPSLYAAFGPLLEEMSPKEMKIFLAENFPLYHAQLVTIQEMKGQNDDEATYQPRDLVGLRQEIKKLAVALAGQPAEERRQCLMADKASRLETMKANFQERFGISKVPGEFSRENLRSLQDCIRYLGNLSDRNPDREATLAFFLGLKLNGQWEKFRRGEEIDPAEYISGRQLEIIKPILAERLKSYALSQEIAGLSAEKAKRFQEILQQETSSNMIGSVQTVDIKLANIKGNIIELADPDIYDNPADRDLVKLLVGSGKAVNSVLAKIFAAEDGKKVEFNDQEKLIQTRLEIIYNISHWDKKQVEEIQDRIQPFSLVNNMISRMRTEKVDENIAELQERLKPNGGIIEIFNRLGEDFRQESGAVALSRDLTYLESLAVKDDARLSPEEKQAVNNYLGAIREKMKELEQTLDRVKEYFNKLAKSTHLEHQPILQNRLAEVQKIVNSSDAQAVITSQLTKDLNLVIENMRQCLGCLRREANNDTNLAFGDYNKFFMMSQSEKERGSIADEIVFCLPVKTAAGHQEMSFVMDNVYGQKLPDILLANIKTLYKKQQAIKKEIPEAKISITVSQAALSSVGLPSEILIKRLKELLPDIRSAKEEAGLTATISASAFGDNYVEFGSLDARGTGESQFSGVVIH